MLNAPIDKISTVQPMRLHCHKPIFRSILTISVANNTYTVYPNQHFLAPWEQHIHYNAVPAPYVTTPTDSSGASSQSSELQLALLALPSSTMVTANTLDMRVLNQSTSTANIVIPSKEIASAAPILSHGIICWNATSHAFQDPCHIPLSIPIKFGVVKAHALVDTGAQCSVLSLGLVKRAFDKQSLQLLICGKIKVVDGNIVNARGPVVLTIESMFGEHMIKWVILDDDGKDQCIISTDILTHPDIHAMLNFKENHIKIQDLKLLLK
uniref:Peptidase A2 domain-containing protein n=1 Tax=Romanomermis culicivorax TaxID=13658 RepID=A0A915KUX7_ROMCU